MYVIVYYEQDCTQMCPECGEDAEAPDRYIHRWHDGRNVPTNKLGLRPCSPRWIDFVFLLSYISG